MAKESYNFYFDIAKLRRSDGERIAKKSLVFFLSDEPGINYLRHKIRLACGFKWFIGMAAACWVNQNYSPSARYLNTTRVSYMQRRNKIEKNMLGLKFIVVCFNPIWRTAVSNSIKQNAYPRRNYPTININNRTPSKSTPSIPNRRLMLLSTPSNKELPSAKTNNDHV